MPQEKQNEGRSSTAITAFEDATRERFERDGREIISFRSGAHTGRPIVLLHGIGMGHGYWKGLAEELAEYGPVFALDLPGFGESPEPKEPLDMPASGAFVADFVRAEGLSDVILIGHSMGTQVAVEAAAAAPELFPDLILLAPTINATERSISRQALRMLQDMMSFQPRTLYYGARYYLAAGPRWYVKKLATMLTHEVERTLPRVRAHTLVVHGERDFLCPTVWVDEVVSRIPDAHAATVPGRGHETMISGYPEVARAIRTHLGLPAPTPRSVKG
ncbi:alpha/beta hydrolase [Mycetocola tolaasinivorans]|uniref:Alpha/beta hydrolase n=1 Tax=Mycetocola tolaasinivorans TaxID=76635 RepID=A0A3L6ZYA4_9MICO|nr:alpha/beta hydrolase [Mycetocola tolaasinivorans]RLP72685.1 alpha/beta hydrolase [Mycetocola tolaasinivorans]